MPRAISNGDENLNGTDVGGCRASSHCVDSTGYMVSFPPKKSLLQEFSGTAKDLFFAGDDPLRQYKEQPSWSKRVWLSLQNVFPVLEWGRHYTLGKFKGDLIAGLTIASLCIPQVLYSVNHSIRCQSKCLLFWNVCISSMYTVRWFINVALNKGFFSELGYRLLEACSSTTRDWVV
jgi:hypothetical protein